MAAKAGSVHLIFSKDWKLGRKGGARPHPILCPHSQSSVDWPQEVHQKLTSNPTSNPTSSPTKTTQSQTAHNSITTAPPHHCSPHFLCGRNNNTSSQPHPLTFVDSPPIRPYSPHNHTDVVCLINGYGLTFDLLPRPPWHMAGFRGHTGRGHAHLSCITRTSRPGRRRAHACHAMPYTYRTRTCT